MIYNAKENRLNIGDIQIDYITFGKGDKPLVMIQGLNTRDINGAAVSLAHMYRIFTKNYKVYVFNRRRGVFDGITVRDLAKDIAMAMDMLKIKNADILGVSQGGMIAQYIAIDRPDLVHKLVLAVTLSRNNDTVKEVVSNWIKITEKGNIKELILDMSEKMYSDLYLKKYKLFIPILTILQKPKDIKRFIILAKSCLTCNAYEELDKIKCPVFVIGGGEDKVVTSLASDEIAEKLNCKKYIYNNLGHATYEEAKDFNKRVYNFLSE